MVRVCVSHLVCVVICGATTVSFAQVSVPGFQVAEYASVIDPMGLDFDSSGILYVGRDNVGSGGGNGDAVRIHRIGLGGLSVTEYGNSAIIDPDALIVDRNGVFGTPGDILVGGQISNSEGGQISAIHPNQVVDLVFGMTTVFHNPSQFAFDSQQRLLFTNSPNPGTSLSGVYLTTGPGDFPSALFTTSARVGGIAVDSTDRIFVSTIDGRIEVHESDGTLIDNNFVTGLGTGNFLAIGQFGSATTDLFTTNSIGELLRIDLSGNVSLIGSGFDGARGIAFGPDGAMYVSEFNNDRVLRISTVPEPGGLLVLGCLALGLVKRRWRD